MKNAFVVQPLGDQFQPVYNLILGAAGSLGINVFRARSFTTGTNVVETITKAISDSDFLIVDVSDANPNIMLDLGFARGKDKPVILIASSSKNIPSSLAGLRVLIYDLNDADDFIPRLIDALTNASKSPQDYSLKKAIAETKDRNSVFISYSHADMVFYDRLIVHLKPLERDGLIEVWSDTKIRTGDDWKKEIELALKRVTVAVLLISADFLASEFIANNELPTILKKAEGKGTKIIPLILKACRFARDPNLMCFQAINPPEKSLILLAEGDQEVLYDKVAAEVERYLHRA